MPNNARRLGRLSMRRDTVATVREPQRDANAKNGSLHMSSCDLTVRGDCFHSILNEDLMTAIEKPSKVRIIFRVHVLTRICG